MSFKDLILSFKKQFSDIQNDVVVSNPNFFSSLTSCGNIDERPVRIIFCGDTRMGKSTFIDMLLKFILHGEYGEDVSFYPGKGSGPKHTKCIWKLCYGEKNEMNMFYEKIKDPIPINLSEDLKEASTAVTKKAEELFESKEENDKGMLLEVDVIINLKILQDYEFVDTPGFQDNSALTDLTRSCYERAHFICYMTSSNNISEGLSNKTIEIKKIIESFEKRNIDFLSSGRLIFILTHLDKYLKKFITTKNRKVFLRKDEEVEGEDPEEEEIELEVVVKIESEETTREKVNYECETLTKEFYQQLKDGFPLYFRYENIESLRNKIQMIMVCSDLNEVPVLPANDIIYKIFLEKNAHNLCDLLDNINKLSFFDPVQNCILELMRKIDDFYVNFSTKRSIMKDCINQKKKFLNSMIKNLDDNNLNILFKESWERYLLLDEAEITIIRELIDATWVHEVNIRAGVAMKLGYYLKSGLEKIILEVSKDFLDHPEIDDLKLLYDINDFSNPEEFSRSLIGKNDSGYIPSETPSSDPHSVKKKVALASSAVVLTGVAAKVVADRKVVRGRFWDAAGAVKEFGAGLVNWRPWEREVGVDVGERRGMNKTAKWQIGIGMTGLGIAATWYGYSLFSGKVDQWKKEWEEKKKKIRSTKLKKEIEKEWESLEEKKHFICNRWIDIFKNKVREVLQSGIDKLDSWDGYRIKKKVLENLLLYEVDLLDLEFNMLYRTRKKVYKIGAKIPGTGKTDVFEAVLGENQICAYKVCPLVVRSENGVLKCFREIRIMNMNRLRRMDGLIPLICCFKKKEPRKLEYGNRIVEECCLFMPKYPKCLYNNYISTRGAEVEELGEKKKIEIMIGVTNSLKRLHDIGIIHRDVKPSNIMFDINSTVFLIDFGSSLEDSSISGNSFEGSWYFLPPDDIIKIGKEMKSKKVASSSYSFERDLYALGITLAMIWNQKYDVLTSYSLNLSEEAKKHFLGVDWSERLPIPSILSKVNDMKSRGQGVVKTNYDDMKNREPYVRLLYSLIYKCTVLKKEERVQSIDEVLGKLKTIISLLKKK